MNETKPFRKSRSMAKKRQKRKKKVGSFNQKRLCQKIISQKKIANVFSSFWCVRKNFANMKFNTPNAKIHISQSANICTVVQKMKFTAGILIWAILGAQTFVPDPLPPFLLFSRIPGRWGGRGRFGLPCCMCGGGGATAACPPFRSGSPAPLRDVGKGVGSWWILQH